MLISAIGRYIHADCFGKVFLPFTATDAQLLDFFGEKHNNDNERFEYDKFRRFFLFDKKYHLKKYVTPKNYCLLILFLAAVLVAPVVLDGVIKVVTHGVEQPEVVECESQQGACRSCINVVQVIVITSLPHTSDFHQQSQYASGYSK